MKIKEADQKFVQREQETFKSMLTIYCRSRHKTQGELCSDCKAMLDYANERVENCLFLPKKPVCAKCPIHCYKEPWRGRVREVMRFAGPRLIFRDPIAVIRHLSLLLRNDSERVQNFKTRLTQKES